jgi:hypothetical protein
VRLGAVVAESRLDDLAALASAGITDVRLVVRWADLQPGPDRWSGDALDSLRAAVEQASTARLRPWLALLGRRTPGWFEDEGGFADGKAAGRWWPRYVEGVAAAVGDSAGGWFPMVGPVGFAATAFAGRDPDAAAAGRRNLVVAWRDAWRVLQGGPPVASALALQPWDTEWPRALRTGDPTGAGAELEDLAGSGNLTGGIVTIAPASTGEQPAELLVRLADEGPELALVVLASLGGSNDDERAEAATVAVDGVRLAAADGVAIETVFADGLLAADGAPAPAAGVLTALAG